MSAWRPGLCAGLLLALGACRAGQRRETEVPFPLELAFEGEQAFHEEELREAVLRELARLEVTELDKAAVDDAAFALELAYRARGHHDALVDYEFEPRDGTPLARFLIEEGPLVRVRALHLEGLAAIPVQEVRARLEPLASGGPFDERRLAAGLARLRADSRERGFLRFAYRAPEVVFDADRTAVEVRVTFVEGPIFRIVALDFTGGTSELARLERQLVARHVGKPALPRVGPEVEHTLIEAYRRAGHPDVRVEARTEPDEISGDTRLRVAIEPGVRARIAHFRIAGNVRTRDAAILQFLDIERGELYDSERVRAAFRELYRTGLFESVEITLEGEGEERTLAVEVVEARTVEIRLEPGYGSYEGPRLLVGIQEKNFAGLGQIVQLEGTASLKARALRLAWIDRDFLDTEFTSETSAFVEQREEPSYAFVRRGVGFFLRREWTEEWSSSTGYEFRPTDVTEDDVPPLAPDLESDTDVAALSAGLTFNDRDSPLLPSRGRLARAKVEWADDGLGSDTEFIRTQLEFAHLWTLSERSIVASAVRTGWITPFGVTDEIPLPERFFNGGENSVRSFQEDELLPEGRSGEPLGGEAATTLNLEYRRLLTGNLAAALFFDAGNVTEEVEDYLDFEGFRSGYGLGLRYLLPIGPLRVDLGINPNPRDDEDEFVLHVSVGFPF